MQFAVGDTGPVDFGFEQGSEHASCQKSAQYTAIHVRQWRMGGRQQLNGVTNGRGLLFRSFRREPQRLEGESAGISACLQTRFIQPGLTGPRNRGACGLPAIAIRAWAGGV